MNSDQFQELRKKEIKDLQECLANNIGNPQGEFAKYEIENRLIKTVN